VRASGLGISGQAYAPLPTRRRAADLLSELGDPRPGVATLAPAWCGPFPADEYPIGAQRDTLNNQTYTPQTVRLGAFHVARYPVTNAAYAYFVEAGGYQERQWWTEQGWQQRERQRIREAPRLWDDERYNQPTQPVVGVTWYEAAAYCTWLTAQGHVQGWLPAGDTIRLPSEAEWEVAALWDVPTGQVRAWQQPEGELWQNVREAGIGRPSPVGLFPQGAVPCGALDMAGNVWEWCGAYPQGGATIETVFERFDLDVALRGGAYHLQNERSSCSARDGDYPHVWTPNTGFRVFWSLAFIV
jgi:formylglycine-generating enzyme required for sulfatase activity